MIKISSLKYIDPGAFEGLPRLQEIRITAHSLENTPDISSSVGHSLIYFQLCCFSGAYDDIQIKPLVVLETLVLRKVGLTMVPEDIKHVAASLRILDLSRNNISSLTTMYNILFLKLASVSLASNDISYLSPELLQLPSLTRLSLSSNKLTHLANMNASIWGLENQGKPYVLFYVNHNPWHCNGSMMWLRDSICFRASWDLLFYRSMKVEIRLKHLFCHSPPNARGRALVTVDAGDLCEIETCGEYYCMTI